MIEYYAINISTANSSLPLFCDSERQIFPGLYLYAFFSSNKGHVTVYVMKSKGEFQDALELFCKEVGVLRILIVDPSREQTSNEVQNYCHKVGTTLHVLEESTQWANGAKLYIKLFKIQSKLI